MLWRSEIARTAIAQNYQRYVWFVAWPLILLAVFAGCVRSAPTDGQADQTERQQVTDYGAVAILSFVTATPADSAKLSAIYGELIKPPEGQQGIPLPRRTVLASFASAEPPASKDDSWWVTLSTITADGQESWQVPVQVFPSGPRVLQLPGVVPGVSAGPAVAVKAAAPIDVTAKDEAIAVTLRDFFDAWLTGRGDLGRVADTATVPAFSAPPYTRAQLVQAYAGSQIPQQPEGTITAGVTVWATKTSTDQLSYTVTLTAAAGRWVVSDIAAHPLVTETKGDTPAVTAGP